MSADMMIVCKEDNSHYDGDHNKAFFVDETSMGEPWSEFGKWFIQRYRGAPDILQQMNGIKDHTYIELTSADMDGIVTAVGTMGCHEDLEEQMFFEYIKEHIGKHISTENW